MNKYQPNSFRPYSPEDVKRIRGSYQIEHTIAKLGSEKLWQLFNDEPYVKALGCISGNQAIQMVKAGLKSLYASGWQLSSEATINQSGQMYPDMSLYPINSMPKFVEGLNAALLRADQIEASEGKVERDWLVPIIADAESGFTGSLALFELVKSMIRCGISGCHIEDQSPTKLCGHLNNKVLVSTRTFIKQLTAARLACDVSNVPSVVIIGRTDALSAGYIQNDADPIDHQFINFDRRTDDGFYALKGDPMARCISRGLSVSQYCDLLWFETSIPDLMQAKEFSDEIHKQYPDKLLAYNCSPSFNWKKHLSDQEIANFQDRLGELNFRYQFITLAGYHSMNMAMYELASSYRERGMSSYVDLQTREFEWEPYGYGAVKHQKSVGTAYMDAVRQIIDGNNDMSALSGSTEHHQF